MLKDSEQSIKEETPVSYSSPPQNYIFGHLLGYIRDPISFLSNCSLEYGKLVPLRFLSDSALFLNHPDSIEDVFIRQQQNFMRKGQIFELSSKFILGNGLFLNDGKSYQQQRTLLQPAFHKQMLMNYAQVMIDETNSVINMWSDKQVRDVYQDYVAITRTIIARTMFGVTINSEFANVFNVALDATINRFKSVNQDLFITPDWLPTTSNLKLRQSIKQLDQFIYQMIEEHQMGGEKNFLEILLQSQADNNQSITIQQIRDEIINIFLAGHETTAIALTWISWLLSEHPHIEEKLFAEIQTVLQGRIPTVADIPQLPYTEACILETLRLYPPVWIMARVALEKTEILGYPVDQGMEVFVSQWTAHRHPHYFPEPELFKPERWLDGLSKKLPLGAYFPFSLGGRICLGKAFGMMELILLVATITQRYKFKLVPGHQVEPLFGLTLRPKYGMKMEIIKR
ncbi:MAG: cytochrome P450 [Dolichospermum sp.]|nr:cytochrome P450 [Dolichospermum sp.]